MPCGDPPLYAVYPFYPPLSGSNTTHRWWDTDSKSPKIAKWHNAEYDKPEERFTVLLATPKYSRAVPGYWTGDAWYDSSGDEKITQVYAWRRLPKKPDPELFK